MALYSMQKKNSKPTKGGVKMDKIRIVNKDAEELTLKPGIYVYSVSDIREIDIVGKIFHNGQWCLLIPEKEVLDGK